MATVVDTSDQLRCLSGQYRARRSGTDGFLGRSMSPPGSRAAVAKNSRARVACFLRPSMQIVGRSITEWQEAGTRGRCATVELPRQLVMRAALERAKG
jgi:hypothetical protein